MLCLHDSDLFNALPSTLQHSMLLTAAESVTDTLHQCRLLLLVVDRYPGQVKDQGVNIIWKVISKVILYLSLTFLGHITKTSVPFVILLIPHFNIFSYQFYLHH